MMFSFLYLIHDILNMSEWFSKFAESLDSLKEKAEFAERQVKLLENLLIVSEA